MADSDKSAESIESMKQKKPTSITTGPTADSMKAPEGYMTSPEYIANTIEFNGYIYADTDEKHLWPLSKNETVVGDFIKSGNCMWHSAN